MDAVPDVGRVVGARRQVRALVRARKRVLWGDSFVRLPDFGWTFKVSNTCTFLSKGSENLRRSFSQKNALYASTTADGDCFDLNCILVSFCLPCLGEEEGGDDNFCSEVCPFLETFPKSACM